MADEMTLSRRDARKVEQAEKGLRRFIKRRRERRELGITFANVVAVARKQSRDGVKVTADTIRDEIIGDNLDLVERVGERDWASFLEALMKFIEAIMPFLQMFFAFA